MSLFQIIVKGGIVMIPLALCSIAAFAILIERLITLRKMKINTNSFVLQIKNMLLRRRIDDALHLAQQTRGPIARITIAGLSKHNRPREEIKDSIEGAAKSQVYHIERYLGILGTIAAVAPLIGFLGTVTGMIKAFMQVQTLGGSVDASVLAGGIWEALISTAAGLTVGIPALVFYNWLQAKVEHFVFEMQETSTDLMDTLLEQES
ncbi:MAG: MotA/TolQ/ExbB proton channel family protein [candidate division KSB1 bacterium]|nr:MotA/TolQ/ExbB proton channel family protein [candidate division KSB1 bacterium]